ncbi:MAG: serine/threonine-protein kinase [Pseudonocardiaceae bacterium]
MAVPTREEPAHRLVAGRYRLDEVLGRGAMGTVWAAYDEMLGRAVAVKEVLLPPGMPGAEADALRERTLREARAIAVLSHPNVVTLYDVAREAGAPFVVMELVSSRSLAEALLQGPLTPARAAAVGTAVAAALAAAHAAGITHRDVKPGNVLLAHDGRIKLTDFGIARNLADSTLTATGLMLGSPAFMAPEVASGGLVSHAADLWGLGATLFAATEGHPPYDAGDPVETVTAVVHGAVPAPGATGPLAEVITGLMVKDPAARMPLAQVHRLLRPLAGDRVRAPFPALPPQPLAEVAPGRAAPALPPPAPPPPSVPALAADPGPVPWRVPERRRSPAVSVPLAGLAVLLFAIAAVAGFAATRAAAGAPVLPAVATPATRPASDEPDPLATLLPRRVTLPAPDGSDPTTFTVDVPAGWAEFRERRTVAGELESVVRFVSPDGSRVVAIERTAGTDRELGEYADDYLAGIDEAVRRLVEVGRETTGSLLEVTFRTVEGSAAEDGGTGDARNGDGTNEETSSGVELRRTTFLRLLPTRSDLWLVRVTVPTDREEAGRAELFDRVVPDFVPPS